ncbi:mutant gag-pol polyprotein [Striga asiatica]|uniref:Mutant gag-pol polyprotein n=1 Tax=Striga asiatica TaxID=4170 RepID=A0A5A7QE67_STRAF|nr:mutant gag-pol polyprotein [Striga asiatica]
MFRMRIKLPPKSSEYLAAVCWANHKETRTEARSGGLYVDNMPQGGGVALSSNSKGKGNEDEFKDVPESLEYDGPPIWDDKIDDVVVEVDEVHKEKTPKFEEVLCDVVPMHANHILLDSRTNHFEEEGNDGVRSKLSIDSKIDLFQINAELIVREMASKMKEAMSVLLLNFKRRQLIKILEQDLVAFTIPRFLADYIANGSRFSSSSECMPFEFRAIGLMRAGSSIGGDTRTSWMEIVA